MSPSSLMLIFFSPLFLPVSLIPHLLFTFLLFPFSNPQIYPNLSQLSLLLLISLLSLSLLMLSHKQTSPILIFSHKQTSPILIFPFQQPIHLHHPQLFPLNSLLIQQPVQNSHPPLFLALTSKTYKHTSHADQIKIWKSSAKN